MTLNGIPDGGWLLYLYAAASDTPVTSYKDSGLVAGTEHPWPIAADAFGMMPQFWLADGSYRARGTSSDGSRVFFDLSTVLALGPSSGGGGGGATVDPNSIAATGDVKWLDISGTLSGWVRNNGRTIGSATSGATERDNSDCQSLFEWLWNNKSDTQCPVVSGRGLSAGADWTANKQITLPDFRGYGPGCLDDMGNSAAGRFSGVPFASGNATTAGSFCGEPTHTQLVTEMVAHGHVITDPGHVHHSGSSLDAFWTQGGTGQFSGGTGNSIGSLQTTASATTGISLANTGGGAPFNVTSNIVLGTSYRKL